MTKEILMAMKSSATLNVLFLYLLISFLSGGCGRSYVPGEKMEVPGWDEELKKDLDLLGHRNWILVVDKAFPEQSSPGMKYIYLEEELNPVLSRVLEVIDSSSHVTPAVFRDRELAFITEEQASGIETFRKETEKVLKGREVHTLLHNDVFSMLDESSSLFRVLVIKTRTALPYTSVFLRLDCSYWGAGDEARLRSIMAGEASREGGS